MSTKKLLKKGIPRLWKEDPPPYDMEKDVTMLAQGAEAKVYEVRYIAPTTPEDFKSQILQQQQQGRNKEDRNINKVKTHDQSKSQSQEEESYSLSLAGLHSQSSLEKKKADELVFLPIPSVYIVKERIKKTYRHPILDAKLIKERMRQEARIMHRCRAYGIPTPIVYLIDDSNGKMYMEKINGSTVKEYFQSCYEESNKSYHDKAICIAEQLGRLIATFHDHDLVHGDPTTSNFMVRASSNSSSSLSMMKQSLESNSLASKSKNIKKIDNVNNKRQKIDEHQVHDNQINTKKRDSSILSPSASSSLSSSSLLLPSSTTTSKQMAEEEEEEIVVIDFGLGNSNANEEDKAVDLYVLERAIISTHPNSNLLVSTIMEMYAKISQPKKYASVSKRLEDVKRRGRKRDMTG